MARIPAARLLAGLCLLWAPLLFAASPDAALQAALDSAYSAVEADDSGENAQYIPALAAADPEAFGLVIVTVDGRVIERGDTGVPFAIMSAAKPFTLALLLQQQGTQVVLERIGVEPTGLPFNSLEGIDRGVPKPLNPMVNAGAITAVSLLQVDAPEQRWPLLLDYYGRFAGEPLELMGDVYKSVSQSNYRNRALVNLLQVNGWLGADPSSTLDVYNKQSSVAVTARQLAAMGATLANAGINPLSGERVLDAQYVDEVLALMTLGGFYDESGWWAYSAGLPAKSGVGGGIVAVVPGRMAIVGYSPRLSAAGNSVRGMRAIQAISRELELSLFLP
ncbi:MAG: glutaminase A [Halioglobus sp.]|nr:glutaminase A [Halioglobus sp.]|tara:strand:+ start:1189 stop:2190 length:1002 start_codon:yes stop_codon:yes gene_type:complete